MNVAYSLAVAVLVVADTDDKVDAHVFLVDVLVVGDTKAVAVAH